MTKSFSFTVVLVAGLLLLGASNAHAFAHAPTEKDLVQVWSGSNKPFTGSSQVDPQVCDVWQAKKGGTECEPDTLYSWSDIKWADVRLQSLQTPEWNGIWRHLFLTRAPISTFPYGNISMRIKLKAGVKFKDSKARCDVPVEEAETTVYVRTSMLSEFIICSPKVIHSISYGTKEHYDEIIRDYSQHKLNPAAASYYYLMSPKFDLFHTPSVDSVSYSEASLVNNIKFHFGIIVQQKSVLLFNPDLPEDSKTETEHFKTTKPIYFNID